MECFWIPRYSCLITRYIKPSCEFMLHDLVLFTCTFLMGNLHVNSLVFVTQKVPINLVLMS